VHKTPYYATKMILNVVFEKTAFVTFVISNYFKQNINETHSELPTIHTRPWIFKNLSKKISEPKVSRLLPNICDFLNHTLGYGFKNLKKIYSLRYGFLFFVISISLVLLSVRSV
jgi:hypothetical protein